jgi:NAD(P)-dependent dehydrogenase (short-subunit alcohol dehydrogenase family)
MLSQFNINVIGVIHTTNIFLPLLRKGTVKKVIIISSGMGDPDLVLSTGIPNQAPYSISKAAVNMVVAKYAAEYKAEGFVFLALSPGLVDTLTKARESHSRTVTTELLLIRYPATPEEAEAYRTILGYFQTLAPDFEGPITPEKSVSSMFEVINKWTVKDTGVFVSHHGNKQWL